MDHLNVVQKFILLEKVPVGQTGAQNGPNSSEHLPAGCIVKEIEEDEQNMILVESVDVLDHPTTKEKRTPMAIVPIDKLCEISLFSFNLLRVEKDFKLRLIVCRDESWLDEATFIEKGNRVFVISGPVIVSGTVRYIGPLEGEVGTKWFGVELDKIDGLKTIFPAAGDGRPHFQCETGSGIYVTVCNLRLAEIILEEPRPRAKKKRVSTRPQSAVTNSVSSPYNGSGDASSHRKIEKGDRVVWFGGESGAPAHGTVVYVGKIKGSGGEPEVAVEFDDAVGDKKYIGENRKDCNFKVISGYGKVLRLNEIMREQDFGVKSEIRPQSEKKKEPEITSSSKPQENSRTEANRQGFITVGDQVVWMQPVGGDKLVPQRGKAVWFGPVPNQNYSRFGVAFKNECGQKGWTGKMCGKDLFVTKPGHGRLVAEEDLILASVYDEQQKALRNKNTNSNVSASSQNEPEKPLNGRTSDQLGPSDLITSHNELDGYKVGERVLILEMGADRGIGTLKWIGVAKRIDNNIRFGLEMDVQVGDPSDVGFSGTLGDVKNGYYDCYQCEPGHGKFVLKSEIIKLSETEIEDPRKGETGAWTKVEKGKHPHKIPPPEAKIEPRTHGFIDKVTSAASGVISMITDFVIDPVKISNHSAPEATRQVFQLKQHVRSLQFGNAVIEWLGNVENVYHAGIRLENPIRCPQTSGGGSLSGIELFVAKPGFGAFVPVDTLRTNGETAVSRDQKPADRMSGEEIRKAVAEADKNEKISNDLKSAVEVFRLMGESAGLDVGVKPDGISGYVKYYPRSEAEIPYCLARVTLPAAAHHQLHLTELERSEIIIEYFPPVFVNFKVGPEYLTGSPPVFEEVCSWLPAGQIVYLQTALAQLWMDSSDQEHHQRLCSVFTQIKTHMLQALGIGFCLTLITQQAVNTGLFDTDSLGVVICASDQDVLAKFDKIQKFSKKEETKTFVECVVCTNTVPPGEMTFFSRSFCPHMFCKDCVSNHIQSQLENGNHSKIPCLGDECKVVHTLHELADIVSPEVMEQFAGQLLQRSLEGMGDIWRCPGCEWACIFQQEMLGNDRYVVCQGENCGRRYCPHCRGQEHGAEPCLTFEQKRALKLQYDAATAQGKLELERQHGKDNIKHAMEDYDAEEFIRLNMKPCPNCKAPTQKIEGCNKMTCTRCHTFFCYTCGVKLPPPPADAYLHFANGACRKFDR